MTIQSEKLLNNEGVDGGFYPLLCDAVKKKTWQGLADVREEEVKTVLNKARLNIDDFLVLLSPAADRHLERMAQMARHLTRCHFGNTIQLFAPLYLANHCTNGCLYCGFSEKHGIRRHALTPEQVEREAAAIAATGLRRILILTGDAPKLTGIDYLLRCLPPLTRHFTSIGIEIPAMTADEYVRLAQGGVDNMTMFQETYDEKLYDFLHPRGPKRDFKYRLDAPERAVKGGMRAINLGALLGLGPWQSDFFLTALHAQYLQQRYPWVDIAFSLPRIRPCGPDHGKGLGGFTPMPMTDRELVRAATALRIFMPHAGITLSTRESAAFRDRMVHMGVTRISAGVSTAVGGYDQDDSADSQKPLHAQRCGNSQSAAKNSDDGNGMNNMDNSDADVPQFDIADTRGVAEVVRDLENMGLQPIFTDWLMPGKALPDTGRPVMTPQGAADFSPAVAQSTTGG